MTVPTPPTPTPPTPTPPTEPLARACASTRAVLARIRPGQLGDPTPCASWDVRALISHFVGTPAWAAASVRSGDGIPAPDRDYAADDYLARPGGRAGPGRAGGGVGRAGARRAGVPAAR